MDNKNSSKQLYVVISQTGTLLSRLLKVITGAEYNHASISMSVDLNQMFSFGRRHPYNPFWGGFVLESPHFGTFKRFKGTKIIVLAVDISGEKYIELYNLLSRMHLQRENYHYNYLGLFLAALHITRRKKNCYYCSEFVRDVLLKGSVDGAEQLAPIVQPMHFLNLPHKVLYRGRLSDYAAEGLLTRV